MKYIGIILLSALLISCGNKEEKTETTETSLESNVAQLSQQQKKNIGLQLGKLTQQNVSSILKLSGQIDVPPQNMISISIPLGGFLKSTQLLQGMHVRKGQVLAILEDQQYILLQQNYLTTKVKLKQAAQDYERQKALNKNLASSDKIFQQATSDYEMLKIQLNSLAQELKLININANSLNSANISTRISIISPIDGYVTKVNANIGKHIDTNEILFELVNPDDLHLALTVFEKDAIQLKIEQKLIAYSNDQPDKKYLCEILLVGKDFGADRSLLVHCHFENEKETQGLIPGMFMNAEVEVKSGNKPCLPQDAIISYEGKDYVFVANDASHFKMTEVKTGSNEKGFTAIENAEALNNKNIVVHGAYDLLMSLKNTEE
ncbi:efflux transporter periplasmic adaptor subunit [Pedobacter psychrophilus]|uniref:Efflux transporter periplasmic adaptor subunit n=1 Tax=Pedobacter psychrophilus TaxID=1826909 RepID=A0A179DLP8_9SPHI|nr:efflux RND transporter periplasmic adaptor subunit [Pedobacter psychrophilus]OAQ41818.1 efflux transporter periplasmic adaptor subunit [Pedobacter psychrophilus]